MQPINATKGGWTKLRETKMRQFTISAVAVAVFAVLLATLPAQAEILGGGPKQVGNQCFTYSKGNEKEGRFGSWGACPQAASANASTGAAATSRSTRRNRAASR